MRQRNVPAPLQMKPSDSLLEVMRVNHERAALGLLNDLNDKIAVAIDKLLDQGHPLSKRGQYPDSRILLKKWYLDALVDDLSVWHSGHHVTQKVPVSDRKDIYKIMDFMRFRVGEVVRIDRSIPEIIKSISFSSGVPVPDFEVEAFRNYVLAAAEHAFDMYAQSVEIVLEERAKEREESDRRKR